MINNIFYYLLHTYLLSFVIACIKSEDKSLPNLSGILILIVYGLMIINFFEIPNKEEFVFLLNRINLYSIAVFLFSGLPLLLLFRKVRLTIVGFWLIFTYLIANNQAVSVFLESLLQGQSVIGDISLTIIIDRDSSWSAFYVLKNSTFELVYLFFIAIVVSICSAKNRKTKKPS